MRKNQIFIYSILYLMLLNNQSVGAFHTFKKHVCEQSSGQLTSSTNLIPFNPSLFFHDEVVATFSFEQYSNELLLLRATVEKNHFIHAIKSVGDCMPKDMMQVCGNKYVLEKLEVKINDQEIALQEESLNIQKDVVVLTYTIPITKQGIQQVNVTSDYMFAFNNHSILKVIFDLNNSTRRTFNIRNKRRTITANFK